MSETENRCNCRARAGELRLLVIGCGNPMAGDDSAGIEIVRRVEARDGCGCQLRLLPNSGVQLLQFFDQADVILFVDAVVSGAPPGTLHLVPRLDEPGAGLEPRALGALSSHGWGLTESLLLTRVLRRRMPRLVLLAVEIQNALLGSARSPAVEQAIRTVVEEFPRLRSWLTDPTASELERPRQAPPGENLFEGEGKCA